jgi:peroxiredoxin
VAAGTGTLLTVEVVVGRDRGAVGTRRPVAIAFGRVVEPIGCMSVNHPDCAMAPRVAQPPLLEETIMLLDTPVCDFGWQVPDFSLPDPQGKQHAMRDHLTRKGILIVFICNHCPYVKRIAARMAEDLNTLQADGLGVLAIMSNDYTRHPDDSPEHMTRFAQGHGFEFPYLVDEDQAVAHALGAVCTPDFFGFNGNGGLQYRGRFEDPMTGERDLLIAMRQIMTTGEGPREQTASMGCSIKWR